MPDVAASHRRGSWATLACAALLAWAGGATPAAAQHEQHGAGGAGIRPVAGVPHTREGSGTAWLPDLTPMYAHHGMLGAWEWMLHENLFFQYLDDGGTRGHEQFGSINWLMAMARRQVGDGVLSLRGMFSAEPWTVGDCGYPDLLATGETCDGEPLVDRQHPHDLFMELAVDYTHPLTETLGLQLYAGTVAEPALGPVDFTHRVSALANPIAPVTHHWIDATHISYGVATVGLFGRTWKAEGSIFNGREPDENRTDFDWGALDSYSGRVSLAPNENWVLQLSAAHLEEAELPHELGESRVDVERITASATHHHEVGEGAFMATTLVWGRNDEEDVSTDAFLVESSVRFGVQEVFARGELVQKAAHDLRIEELEDDVFRVGKLSVGYVLDLPLETALVPALGLAGSLSFVPDELEPFYGEKRPFGWAVFLRLRPPAVK